MKHYNFYYDESEHSRVINSKTILADNYYDNFITATVGWKSEYERKISEKYLDFEDKYLDRKSNGELKSSTLKNKQLASGFASLSRKNVSFLEDFFNLFDDDILLYFFFASKIEYLIYQIFEDYENSLLVDMDLMKYSIIKAIVTYQPKEIIEKMAVNSDTLVAQLIDFFKKRIEINKSNLDLKEQENYTFELILLVLRDVSAVRKIRWDYTNSFLGFGKFVEEKSIHNYSLIIDREGEKEATLNAAKQSGIANVTQEESINSFGIRMSDMIVGIVSKLAKALHSALKVDYSDGKPVKKILTREWFSINESQLNLYKKLHYIFMELNNSWYKVYAGIFSDDLILFISLLQFMNHFETIEDINENIEMQGEYFNSLCLESLAAHFERMSNKLPIEPIRVDSSEWFFNQKGAKVFFDIAKQPVLPIKEGSQTYNVLSVGAYRGIIPVVTLSENNEAKCYRLPDELSNWAFACVAVANKGEKLFPEKVTFSKEGKKYYADIH